MQIGAVKFIMEMNLNGGGGLLSGCMCISSYLFLFNFSNVNSK